MNALQKIRMGLLLANIKLERVCTHDESYPKDPNPENWRTISGAKVHLTNGRIDGGASGKFKGRAWTGAKPHGSNSFFPERRQQQNLFSNSWEKMRTNKEESSVARISRRAKERKARYEAKKAAGLAKQAEVRTHALNTMREFTNEVKSDPKAAKRAEMFLEHKKNAKYKDTPEYKELEAAVKAAKESKKTSPSGLGQKLKTWKDYDEHVLHAPITEEERAEAEKVIGEVPVANHTKRDLVREAVMVKRHDKLLKEIDENHPLYVGIKNYRDLYQRNYNERLSEGQKSYQQAQILAEYNPKIESAAKKWGKARTDKSKEAAAQEYINEVMARDAKLNPKAFPESLGGVKRGTPMTPAKADATNANPNFTKGKQYRVNCQTCVVVYEARLRGYDVTATGNTRGSLNQQLSYDTTLAWRTKDGYQPTPQIPKGIYGGNGKTSPQKLTDWLSSNVDEGRRYTLSVIWNKRKSGHIVNVWKNPKNGKLEIVDPQTGEMITNLHGNKTGRVYESIESFFANTNMSDKRPPKLTRVDDLEFDNEFVDKLLSRRKKK